MRPTARPTFRRRAQPPAPIDAELSERDHRAIRETGYRQALYQGWFATALEQTRSVFTLASAGVGLSLTLIFGEHTKGPESWAPVWLFLATMVFAASSGFCIWVFRVNGRLAIKLIRDEEHTAEDGLVGRLDRASRIGFGAGLMFLLFSAVSQVWL